MVIAIVLSSFIRKQYGDKIKIWAYGIFSCLLISYPLINQYFIYQPTNLPITISNLLVIICVITLFENYFHENIKKTNILIGLILMFTISIYESVAQTYLVMLFVTIFIKLTNTDIEKKSLLKYFGLGIILLISGILLYFITGNIVLFILEKCNMLQENYAFSASPWPDSRLPMSAKMYLFNKKVIRELSKNLCQYFPVVEFGILSLITFVLELVKLIKTNKIGRMIAALGAIASNFILIIMLVEVIYRMQFSWIITVAFLGIYVYQSLCNKKILKYIIPVLAILLIIMQTRTLNQYFYNEYKKYEKEKVIAHDIAINVVKNYNYKEKPLFYVVNNTTTKDRIRYKINHDNGNYVMIWGVTAFGECCVETTKFINEQGYDFLYVEEDKIGEITAEYEKLDQETKKQPIVELENAIVVNLNVYDF